jgi:hypothetical protein
VPCPKNDLTAEDAERQSRNQIKKNFGPRITRTKRLKTGYPEIAQILADSVGATLRGCPVCHSRAGGNPLQTLNFCELVIENHDKDLQAIQGGDS